MRKLIPYLAVLMAVSMMLIVSACDRPAGDRTTTSDRPQTGMNDSDVEKVLKERFNSDPQLRDSDIDVSANADNNEIRLSGTVHSEEIRQRAVQIAQGSVPGFSVSDTIDVEPREMARSETGAGTTTGMDEQQMNQHREAARNRGDNIGNSPEDARIYSQIVGQLSSSNLPFQQIKIDVNEGTVTLRGNVTDNNQKTEAQRAAQQIEGVKQVNNELEVGGGTQSRPTQ